MRCCSYCGRENEDGASRCRECGTPFEDTDAESEHPGPEAEVEGIVPGLKSRWFVGLVALLALLGVVTVRLSHRARGGTAPVVVILATWSSNGEQFVTFRPEPPTAEVTYADLVSASAGTNAQPRTVRNGGEVFPVRGVQDGTNFSLRFAALPVRTLTPPGKPPVAYTPGSYTVAYTPTEDGCRVRLGVALDRKGIGDYLGRMRRCWEHKGLGFLLFKSHEDPAFVILGPTTNVVHGKP